MIPNAVSSLISRMTGVSVESLSGFVLGFEESSSSFSVESTESSLFDCAVAGAVVAAVSVLLSQARTEKNKHRDNILGIFIIAKPSIKTVSFCFRMVWAEPLRFFCSKLTRLLVCERLVKENFL